ncbi:hypothetical protein G7A66_00060 [Altererythrobacter sp. SALINAS58]|uniref:hypothetical protein n=1 Tax=Alteripontixanthobacter muriae TaxID=2705546 RepID=UPI001575775E|nr:hypothetical protein [Alteripontixanthobacter muriae]NTZ41510.1 hypothetical protein [Alteripontixanthobacter muriae]
MRVLVPVLAFATIPMHVQAQEVDVAPRFDLVCLGAGSANKVTNGSVSAWDSAGNYGTANIVGNRAVPFDDQVNLWIEGESGQIRMPRAMLPLIRGGEDGWFKVKSIEIGEDEITGSIAVNPFNNPKLRIDRITGAISISGKAGNYSGQCTKYDPETVERAF